jgi:sugar phosphate isomerase/epimerase
MKKSIFSWFGFIQPLGDRLLAIREAGFDGVSIWWEDETYPNVIKKEIMPSMVEKAGLHFENMHTPYLDVNDLWSADGTLRNATIERYKGYLDHCQQFQIPVMVMHATDMGGPNTLLPQGLESFGLIREHARTRGVKVAVENTRDADLVDQLLHELNDDHFGLCYDSSHDWLSGQTKGALLSTWAHRVFTTHLSDNDTEQDRHWIPGDGKVNWALLATLLKRTNLDYISMELVGSAQPMDDPTTFLRKAFEQLSVLVTK